MLNPTKVKFPIEPRDQKGNLLDFKKLNIGVEGPEKVQASFTTGDNGSIFIIFTTTSPGDFKISVTFQGEHIQYSPITVTVKPKREGDDQPKTPHLPEHPIQQSPPPIDSTPKAVKFQVDAVDGDGNPIAETNLNVFEVSTSGPETFVVAKIVKNEGGKLLVTFDTFNGEGEFNIGIKYKGQHIQRSPFTVCLSKKEDEDETEEDEDEIASLPPLPEDGYKTLQFKVDAKAQDGMTKLKASDLVAIVDESATETWDPKVIEDPDDPSSLLLVSFVTSQLGRFTVSVREKSSYSHIMNSPFIINAAPVT